MILHFALFFIFLFMFAYAETTDHEPEKEAENEDALDFEELLGSLLRMERKLLKARAQQQKSYANIIKEHPLEPCTCLKGYRGEPGFPGVPGWKGEPSEKHFGQKGFKGDSFTVEPMYGFGRN